jgi:ribosomal-protein-alanine N-acetyltransferase
MSELETARLRLRPLRRSDLDALERIYLDPEVARFLITRPQTREDVSRNLDNMLEQAKHFGLWAIELKETGELIGRAGFYGYTMGGSLEPELAYLLRRDCWGKGLATEAALAALAHLHAERDPRRVVATVVPEHAVSRHILEKLGMREVGSIQIRGKDVLVYATDGASGQR